MYVLKLTIRGKVQGVGYRRWFEQHAKSLGLKGYVKNLANGCVEAVVLGHKHAIDAIMGCTIHEAPVKGKIDEVLYEDVTTEAKRLYTDFQIVRD